MTNNWSQQQLEADIIERANQDSAFRQALTSNHKAALMAGARFTHVLLMLTITMCVAVNRGGVRLANFCNGI